MTRPDDPPKLLLTGAPGSGKTTLVRRVVDAVGDLRPAGFLTAEIREGGERRGFLAVGLDGREALLAHVDLGGPRVGRYGVDVVGFERFLAGLDLGGAGLVVVDEIGKMECLCGRFAAFVREVLDGPLPVLATVARHGAGLIAAAKQRPAVEVIEVRTGNRDGLVAQVVRRLREGGAPS